MKRLAVAAMAALALVFAAPAAPRTSAPELAPVASAFAMRPVEVFCYENDEPESPYAFDAWGYVYVPLAKQREMHLDKRICAGAARVNDRSIPEWLRAVGVSVLVHEAYHLRRWGAAGNEAKVECQAIRHWKAAARMLGATEQTIRDIWGDALAAHYRLTQQNPKYRLPGCKVPPLLSDEELYG